MQHAAGLAEVCVPAHVLLDHLLNFLRAQRARYPCASSDDQIFRHGWPPFRLKDERGRGESTDPHPPHPALSLFGGEGSKDSLSLSEGEGRGEGESPSYASSGQTTMPVPERQARAGM